MNDFVFPTTFSGSDSLIDMHVEPDHSGNHIHKAPAYPGGVTTMLPDGVEVVNTEDGEIVN